MIWYRSRNDGKLQILTSVTRFVVGNSNSYRNKIYKKTLFFTFNHASVLFIYFCMILLNSLGLSSYSTVELPFYSKYLLIAAYLASHNPAKTDRQFFCKTTAKKMSKRAKVAAKTGVKTSSQLKGSVFLM